MKKGNRMKWVAILGAVFLVSTIGIGISAQMGDRPQESRADIITIDTLQMFGKLEKPAVAFLHDRHTDAMEKQGKDCSVCHFAKAKTTRIPGTFPDALKGIDPLSPKFKRLEDTAKKEVMDVYHTFCISCHTETAAEGIDSGPVTCGECHREAEFASNRQPLGMDKNLHWRHTKAQDKKCEMCHHAYDETKKQLYYPKGEEGTCRYCHKAEAEENRISMREASHIDCISCHRGLLKQEKKAGPVKCAGCHHPISQNNFEKVAEVPRMERNQPDLTLVKTVVLKEGETLEEPPTRMRPVAFNHKDHEAYNDTCRVCHHAAMESCAKCHTVTGEKTGDWLKLEQAHHRIDADSSCFGCHETQKEKNACAGCHVFMSKTRKQPDAACLKCHSDIAPDTEELVKKDPKRVAEMIANSWTYTTKTYKEKDIPEEVKIDVIRQEKDQYEAVTLPHRKIVNALKKGVDDSKLATYFHRDPGTLCQGCHHNSPLDVKPPKCNTCHGKPFDENQPQRPGLLAAYHQQCMTCHKEMKLEKPAGCIGCHKEKL